MSNQTDAYEVDSGDSESLGAFPGMAISLVYLDQALGAVVKVTPTGFQRSYTDSTGLI